MGKALTSYYISNLRSPTIALILLWPFTSFRGQVQAAKPPLEASAISVVRNVTKPAKITQPDWTRDVLKPLRKAQKQAKAKAKREAQARYEAYLRTTAGRVRSTWTYGNDYDYLNCTAYVASRIRVPNSMGNANQWGYRLGYKSKPAKGAIAWTTAGWAGHVAIVERVSGNRVYVSEYNFIPYSYSERWTFAWEWSGYIY